MDQYTEVTSQGWLSRLGESIKGVVTGLIIFLIAFPLLFWNEGRAVKRAQDLSEGRGAVVSLDAAKVDSGNAGKLVHLSGLATTTDTLSDDEFRVTSENTIALKRVVEMYQWKEHEESKTEKKVGGKKETVTTYTYDKGWSSQVINSGSFKKPTDHQNPGSMPFDSNETRAQKVTLGEFDLGSLANNISSWENLSVSAPLPKSGERPMLNVNGGYYFGADPASPQIGDLKISFQYIKPLDVSVVAVQSGDTFAPYQGSSGSTIFRLTAGTHSADQMFESMESENTMMLWILRIIGFLMMMGGISAVFKPLVVVADVIPFFGNLLEFGFGIVAFVIAAPLTLITIAIGWIAYRPLIGIMLLLAAGLILGGGIFLAKKLKKG